MGYKYFRQNRWLAGVTAVVALSLSCALQADSKTHQFKIASQDVGPALMALGEEAGVEIVLTQEVGRSTKLAGIDGEYTLNGALEKMLEGTGLVYEFVSDNSVVILKSDTTHRRKETAEGDSGLEEVVVTATKRSTSLQDTAMAISAVSGKELEERGIINITKALSLVPGVDLVSTAPGNSNIVIRGVATEQFSPTGLTSNATTSTYIDDIPISLGTRDIRMVDLSHIEVLKGPQGTLYGQSAMGGVVRYMTNRPNFDRYEGGVSSYASDFNKGGFNYGTSGYFNAPISEDLAVRAVAYHYDNSGFIDVTADDVANANTEQTTGGRLALKWGISDRVMLDATYIYQKIDLGSEQSISNTFTPIPYAVGLNIPSDLKGPNLSDRKAQFLSPSSIKDQIVNLKLEVAFDTFTLFAMGSHKDANSNTLSDVCLYVDITGAPNGQFRCPFDTSVQRDNDTFELRLVSNRSEDAFFDWIIGSWYEDTFTSYTVDDVAIAPPGDTILFFGIVPFTNGTVLENWDREVENHERAVYGELGLNFTDKLKLTLGYRWSHVKIDRRTIRADGIFDIFAARNAAIGLESNVSENVNTYKANLEYRLSDTILVYALASSGYRAGGFNVGAAPIVPPTDYSSDTLWNYEVGAKTSWLDKRVTLNISAYRIDWSDIQLRVTEPPTFVPTIINASRARIQGIELEAATLLTDEFTLFGSVELKDAELTEDVLLSSGAVYAGAALPSSTKFSYTVSLNWRRPLITAADLVANVTHRYVDERPGPLGSGKILSGNDLTDVQFGVEHENGLRFTVFAENLFNNVVFMNQIDIGSFHILGGINQPRVIGFRFDYKF